MGFATSLFTTFAQMNKQQILKEIRLSFSRSSGAGGQHVNKVSTKVLLQFHVQNSEGLSGEEKELILKNLANRISKEAVFSIRVSKSRSQLKNKEKAIVLFFKQMEEALRPVKKRKPTKVPKSARLKRLKKKKNRAIIKANRQKPRLD